MDFLGSINSCPNILFRKRNSSIAGYKRRPFLSLQNNQIIKSDCRTDASHIVGTSLGIGVRGAERQEGVPRESGSSGARRGRPVGAIDAL